MRFALENARDEAHPSEFGQEKRGMATMITEECINCGACEPECPNTAIYEGGVQFEAPDGAMQDALTEDIYYIVPQKCTECVGFFDQEQCAAVCPVDCCIPNPEIPETEDVLLARAKTLHADVQIPEPPPSRFRR
jgi:ferredoxin